MQIIAGIDEVGRGALAGPVFVGAAIIPDDPQWAEGLIATLGRKLGDSKQFTKLQRERAAAWLANECRSATGQASADEINELGIVDATKLAAGRALDGLMPHFTHIQADAGLKHPYEYPTEWFIKGDEHKLPILCASIIAKVARDSFMTKLAAEYPVYGWEKNAGYGSMMHRQAILDHGVTPEHRALFIRGTLRGRVSL